MDELITCEICNEYQGTNQQVAMHKRACKAKQERAEKRKERIPIGVPKKNSPDHPDDDFHYHDFNDNWQVQPNRIQRALDGGYEVDENTPPRNVGTNKDGSQIKAIRMKIPKELYEEDQIAKQKEVDRVDEAIRRGKLEEKANDNRYIPDGIKIWSSHSENR